MAREYPEDTHLRIAFNAIEEGAPSTLLVQFMADYGLPARVIAGCSGVSLPTLYQHLNADESVRLTRQVEPKLVAVLERLKTLAVEGKLNLTGSARERDAQLIELLTIEEAEQ